MNIIVEPDVAPHLESIRHDSLYCRFQATSLDKFYNPEDSTVVHVWAPVVTQAPMNILYYDEKDAWDWKVLAAVRCREFPLLVIGRITELPGPKGFNELTWTLQYSLMWSNLQISFTRYVHCKSFTVVNIAEVIADRSQSLIAVNRELHYHRSFTNPDFISIFPEEAQEEIRAVQTIYSL